MKLCYRKIWYVQVPSGRRSVIRIIVNMEMMQYRNVLDAYSGQLALCRLWQLLDFGD